MANTNELNCIFIDVLSHINLFLSYWSFAYIMVPGFVFNSVCVDFSYTFSVFCLFVHFLKLVCVPF